MAFRKLFFDWPLPDRTRPVRLDRIRCWFDGEPIVVDIFCRDLYCQEVITIPPRTLLWNILFDFLYDWAIIRTHQEDQEIEDVISLLEYMVDFLRPPPGAQMSYVLFDILIVFLFDAIFLQEHCTYYQRSVLFFYPEIILTNPESSPSPHLCSCLN